MHVHMPIQMRCYPKGLRAEGWVGCIRRLGRDLQKLLFRIDEGRIYLKLELPIATDLSSEIY